MDFSEFTIEDMISGDWTLEVTCGNCGRSAVLTPNNFRLNADAFREKTITRMRWRCRKCGERERFKLTTFIERFRGNSLHQVHVIADRTARE